MRKPFPRQHLPVFADRTDAAPRDRAGAFCGSNSDGQPMNTLVRLVIIIVAGFSVWKFSDAFFLSIRTLAKPTDEHWFDFLSAFCEGVLGPALALSAIILSATNRHLHLAAIFAVLALAVYVAPIAAFIIGIFIYGF